MDDLQSARDAVATAIATLQAFTGTAGSTEMRQVQNALDYCGCAYSCLRDQSENNPAWNY